MKTTIALLVSLMTGVVIAMTGASCEGGGKTPVASTPNVPPFFARSMPSLEGATGWIDSAPLDANALRGKVVLVDFWTYTCVNWMRTAPYLRLWADKYKDAGLVVIGVHSPEFAFEQDPARVRRLTAAMDLGYPVAIDSRHAIWRAFGNQYWPALYFVDAQGKIRHRLFGESDYDKAESVLRSLLQEAGARNLPPIAPVTGEGPEAAADWTHLASQETYLGHARTERFASPDGIVHGARYVYRLPARLHDNDWALAGDWTMGPEAVHANTGDARVVFRFHARDVHLVMGSDTPVRIRVRIDGKPPGASHGTDIDADGAGIVSEYRMYQLVRQSVTIEDREIEVLFLDPGVELFAFTFG